MEITNIKTFLDYYEKIRQRTLRVVECIPSGQIEWAYESNKFSIGDLVRHVCAIERYMYAENAQFKPSAYPGHGRNLADGYQAVLDFMERTHRESMEIFARLSDSDLQKKCLTPNNTPITLWKWLRAMVEHEIHHRGQIYLYLAMMAVPTPPLYGLTSEEVRELSRD